jgi:hypothetical protein
MGYKQNFPGSHKAKSGGAGNKTMCQITKNRFSDIERERRLPEV